MRSSRLLLGETRVEWEEPVDEDDDDADEEEESIRLGRLGGSNESGVDRGDGTRGIVEMVSTSREERVRGVEDVI